MVVLSWLLKNQMVFIIFLERIHLAILEKVRQFQKILKKRKLSRLLQKEYKWRLNEKSISFCHGTGGKAIYVILFSALSEMGIMPIKIKKIIVDQQHVRLLRHVWSKV
jgi:hypothetical protein